MLRAQVTPITNAELSGSGNAVLSGAQFNVQSGAALNIQSGGALTVQSSSQLTVASGGTLAADAGSVIDFFHATVALPDALTLKNLKFDGSDTQLLNAATLTLQSGSTFTAAAGSSVDLSAADTVFPTTVVLTTGSQTLSGKTLISPFISTISADNSTAMTLSGGSSGATLTLGTGGNADATFSGLRLVVADGPWLADNSVPDPNIFIGPAAGAVKQSTAVSNVGVGIRALGSLTGGISNTAIGTEAMMSFQGAGGNSGDNTAVGYQAMRNATNTNDNTAVGLGAMRSTTTSGYNTAIGNFALEGQTDSGGVNGQNVAIGSAALVSFNGTETVGVGQYAGRFITTGSRNTIVGALAANGVTQSAMNYGTFLGFGAGADKITGDYNTLLGYNTDSTNDAAAATNSTAIGANALITGSNQISLGDTQVSDLLLGSTRLATSASSLFSLQNITNIIGGNSNLVITAGTGFAHTLTLQSTGTDNTPTSFLRGNADGSVTLFGNLSGVNQIHADGDIFTPGRIAMPASGNGGLVWGNDDRLTWVGSGEVRFITTSPTNMFVDVVAGASNKDAMFLFDQVGGDKAAYFGLAGGTDHIVTGASRGSFAFRARSSSIIFSTDSGDSAALLITTGPNLLVGGTSDIPGSHGLKVFGTTASTSTTTGAFQTVGGAGIGGALNVGGNGAFGGTLAVGSSGVFAGPVTISSGTASTSIGTGALVVTGGTGIGGALNVGTNGVLGGTLTVASTGTFGGALSGSSTLAIGGTGTFGGRLRVKNDAGSVNEVGFYDSANVTEYGTIGIASGNGALSIGSSVQDMVVRSQAALRLTAGGSTDRLVISSSDGSVALSSTMASTSSLSGALVVAGGLGLAGDQYLGGSLNFSNAGVVSSGGSLSFNAGGTDQNIALTPSGTGRVTTAAPLTAGGTIKTTATTASTSTTTGALVVAGGFGLAGNQTIGGAINFAGAGAITAGGTDQDITLTPSGTGRVVLSGPVVYSGSQTFSSGVNLAGGAALGGSSGGISLTAAGTNQSITLNPSGNGRVAASGPISTAASTASTSISTGALVVAGGFGLAGDEYLGGSLNLSGGGAVSGSAGSLDFSAGGSDKNITLTPSGAGVVTTGASLAVGGSLNFTVNGIISSGGSLALNAGGTNQDVALAPSGTGVVSTSAPFTAGGALRTTATSASTSTSTGALIVAGGFGLAGDQFLGGSLNLAGGGVVSGAAGNLALTAGGTNQDITLTPSGTGHVVLAGPVTYSGSQAFNSGLTLSGGGAVGGASGSISLTAGGTNQNIALSPSGTGLVTTAAAFRAGGPVSTTATTASTSTTTGALVVAGGFGLAGDQYLGGSLNLAGGGTLTGSSGAVTVTAAGIDKDITLNPSGSGRVTVTSGLNASGAVSLTASTDSTSTSTGALVVSGGAAVQKKTSLGDDVMLTPTTSTAATIRLSGTAVADIPGIWFRDGGSPTAANAALSGSATSTMLNGPAGGSLNLKIGDTNYITLSANSATIETVALNVTNTTASTSNTTGSATFAGGVGVAGRTSSAALSVGSGTAIDLISSATAAFDFPEIAANGGVQDLSITLTGASVGDAVNVVEAGGAFINAGIVLRGIVTATDTVTVRATNTTAAPIDPSSITLRVTLVSF